MNVLLSLFPLKSHMVRCWLSVCFNQKCQIRSAIGELKTSVAFSGQSWGGVERPPGHTRRDSQVLSQEEVERIRPFASLASESGSCSQAAGTGLRCTAFVMRNGLVET